MQVKYIICDDADVYHREFSFFPTAMFQTIKTTEASRGITLI